mgnify:CR=1 FL=1
MERKCIRCNLIIVDEAVECPLCHGVLESTTSGTVSRSVTYPDVTDALRTMQIVIRIVVFAAIVAEIASLIVNYITFNGIYWSFVVGAGLIYGCATLMYSFKERRSLQRIIQVQMLLGIVLVIALDYILGFSGWSYQYAIPIILAGVDIAVVVFMIVRIDGWQNYIMTEIVTYFISIILLVMGLTGFIDITFFGLMAALLTGLILLGTVLLGQRMISNEINRRFNV